MNNYRLAYISFDIVPAPKGAAIHIKAFVQAIAAAFGKTELVTVAFPNETKYLVLPEVVHSTLPALGDTLINRVIHFRNHLATWLENKHFEIIHIRSIYEGFAIALNKQKYCDKLIFEVNGLPSIELKYRYPNVADDWELLHKLRMQEQICFAAADLIVTPSAVTAGYLQGRGVSGEKIRVIPNGVDLDVFSYYEPQRHRERREREDEVFGMVYFGTLSAWQGVSLAVEALALAVRDFAVELVVIGQGQGRSIEGLKKLALRLGVTDKLTILEPMSQIRLVEYIQAADAVVAPLTLNDRNLVQGCCPLKILEGMATGTPVIASDLPVVREIGTDGENLLLVKPGSAKAIKDAVLRLRNDGELAHSLAVAARSHIEKYYTWQEAGKSLVEAYIELGIKRRITI